MVDYQVRLEMTGVQARIIARALDLFVRLGLGQTEEAADFLDTVLDVKDLEALRQTMRAVKVEQLGCPANGSYGIGNSKLHPQVHDAYDVKKALEKVIATVEKHQDFSVWHDGNIVKYGKEPHITASFVKDGQETQVNVKRD